MARRPYASKTHRVKRASHNLTAPGKMWSESPTIKYGPDRPPRQAAGGANWCLTLRPTSFLAVVIRAQNWSGSMTVPTPVGGGGDLTLGDQSDSTYLPMWAERKSGTYDSAGVRVWGFFDGPLNLAGPITTVQMGARVRRVTGAGLTAMEDFRLWGVHHYYPAPNLAFDFNFAYEDEPLATQQAAAVGTDFTDVVTPLFLNQPPTFDPTPPYVASDSLDYYANERYLAVHEVSAWQISGWAVGRYEWHLSDMWMTLCGTG